MKRAAWTVGLFCCAVSGCASGLVHQAPLGGADLSIARHQAQSSLIAVAGDSGLRILGTGADPVIANEPVGIAVGYQPPIPRDAAENVPRPLPSPTPRKSSGKPQGGDRLSRRLLDTEVDIRLPEGETPEDLAAERWANLPNDVRDVGHRSLVGCSWTPWTICYRPLYFEDVNLERYGISHGVWQPAYSGVRFLGEAMLMPCQLIIQPPRSCQCSNGFSRIDDSPWLARYARHQEFVLLGPKDRGYSEYGDDIRPPCIEPYILPSPQETIFRAPAPTTDSTFIPPEAPPTKAQQAPAASRQPIQYFKNQPIEESFEQTAPDRESFAPVEETEDTFEPAEEAEEQAEAEAETVDPADIIPDGEWSTIESLLEEADETPAK